jgi:hypothetical protein
MCGVSFIVCVVVCAWEWCVVLVMISNVIFVLCLMAVPLLQHKSKFAIKINNNMLPPSLELKTKPNKKPAWSRQDFHKQITLLAGCFMIASCMAYSTALKMQSMYIQNDCCFTLCYMAVYSRRQKTFYEASRVVPNQVPGTFMRENWKQTIV